MIVSHSNSSSSPTERWKRRAIWILPALAALLVYASTIDGEFVFDDTSLILQNPAVKQLSRLPEALTSPVWAFKITSPTNYYRPLPIGIFNLLWAGSGGQPWAFHALNVLLHFLNCALLALLVRRLADDETLAFGAALLFAVHPLNTESVAWVAGLPELIYTLLVLAALLLHTSTRVEPPRRWASAPALVCGGVAMFAKETAIVLPALVFIVELFVRPRRQAGPVQAVFRAARRGLPYALATVPYLGIRVLITDGLVPRTHVRLTWLDALYNAPVLLLDYLQALAVPIHLAAYHVFEPIRSMRDPAFAASLAGVVLLLGLGIGLARRRRDLALALGLVILPLLPVLYIPALGSAGFAEHYAYLPAAGAAWIACGIASLLARRLAGDRVARLATATFAIGLALPFAFMTIVRNGDWHDNLSLAQSLIREEPRAYLGHLLLGNHHLDSNEPEQALAVFENGLRTASETVLLETHTIGLRLQLGRIDPEQAIQRLESLSVGESSPSRTPVHLGLGFAYLQAGRPDRAEAEFKRALELTPVADGANFALAVIASKRGDDEAAVEYCRRELLHDPQSNSAHQQLGVNLLRLGRVAEAIRSLETAVSLDARDSRAHGRLAVAYSAAGRPEDARRAWEKALEIDPSYARAREELRRLER